MMMSDLPLDLVEEILSRVPATSVKRLRSTCKRWNALFKDQRFMEKHFRKAPKEYMVLMLKEYTLCSISVNLNNSTSSSIEFQGALGLKDSHSKQVEITDVFHCDGLLLCTTNDSRLVAWNPCLEETRWIQCKTGYESSSRFALGYIQNHKSCRSYKILRRPSYYYDEQRFEIYEFSSDSWRVLDDVVLDCFIIDNGYTSGASFLEGNTYWLAADKKEGHRFILSFDFTAERFKHMCLPPFQNRGIVNLSVGREDQLSALNQSSNNPSKIEMWVTNKIDADELLWSKSFIVDLPIVGNCFWIFTSLLINAEKKVSLCCNIDDLNYGNLVYTIGEDDEYYTETPYTNRKGWLHREEWRPVIFNDVPSLVQIIE